MTNSTSIKVTSLSPKIASDLRKDLQTTAKLIMMNPTSGASMKATMDKYITVAESHFLQGNPKVVAKRLARNTIKDLTETFIKEMQA